MVYDGLLGETIRINGHEGDLIDAYLARPLGSGPYPGVVVIHHMPGYDEATKEIARKFAHHGYAAIMPNLHFREGKGSPEGWVAVVKTGRVLYEMEGVPEEVAREAMRRAAAKLPLRTRFVTRAGTMGGG